MLHFSQVRNWLANCLQVFADKSMFSMQTTGSTKYLFVINKQLLTNWSWNIPFFLASELPCGQQPPAQSHVKAVFDMVTILIY